MIDFKKLVEEERISLKVKEFEINLDRFQDLGEKEYKSAPKVKEYKKEIFSRWKSSNVVPQKQKGFFAVKIKLQTGDISTATARKLAKLVDGYCSDDIRLTIGQGIILKYVREEHFEYIFQELNALGLANPGADSTADITTCPGTDTCNLGISNSTGITKVLEDLIITEYPDFIYNHDSV